MKTLPPILEEIIIWIRGRFSLTGEEKWWLLIFLIIIWTGLLGRYFYLEGQKAAALTSPQIEQLLSP